MRNHTMGFGVWKQLSTRRTASLDSHIYSPYDEAFRIQICSLKSSANVSNSRTNQAQNHCFITSLRMAGNVCKS